jgi:hypothetical protein
VAEETSEGGRIFRVKRDVADMRIAKNWVLAAICWRHCKRASSTRWKY